MPTIIRVTTLFFVITNAMMLAQTAPTFEGVPCLFELPEGQLEGETAECGYVTVPENRQGDTSNSVRLHVVRYNKTDAASTQPPLFLLQGGPGASSQDLVSGIQGPMQEIVQGERDIVIFDQRGNGYSEPSLTCATELNKALTPDLNSQGRSEAQVTALQACYRRLEQSGVETTAYNTTENAEDVNAVREALGYDSITLLGVSYGTKLALEVLRRHPEGIASLILDSVFPPGSSLAQKGAKTIDDSLSLVFAACENDAACAEAYPDLEQLLSDTVTQLNTSSLTLENGQVIDGDFLITVIAEMLNQDRTAGAIPALLASTAKRDTNLLSEVIGDELSENDLDGQGMRQTILCAEDLPLLDSEATLEIRPEIEQGINLDNLEIWQAVCPSWNTQHDTSLDAPVSSDVPTLILSGRLDPVTPPPYAAQVAEMLSNSFLVELPAVGHNTTRQGGGCSFGILLEFLADPTAQPDTSCTEGLELAFILPE
jgi:pimeloyl-ACP methyl ester carboxylesterase